MSHISRRSSSRRWAIRPSRSGRPPSERSSSSSRFIRSEICRSPVRPSLRSAGMRGLTSSMSLTALVRRATIRRHACRREARSECSSSTTPKSRRFSANRCRSVSRLTRSRLRMRRFFGHVAQRHLDRAVESRVAVEDVLEQAGDGLRARGRSRACGGGAEFARPRPAWPRGFLPSGSREGFRPFVEDRSRPRRNHAYPSTESFLFGFKTGSGAAASRPGGATAPPWRNRAGRHGRERASASWVEEKCLLTQWLPRQ